MVVGFTGSQDFLEQNRYQFESDLRLVCELHAPSEIVTGACVGYDEQIQLWFRQNCPGVVRTVVVPSNRSRIGTTCLIDPGAQCVFMPMGTSYRDRNEALVERADVVVGFWTGKTARSGTFMTLNIAKRHGKLRSDNVFGAGSLTSEEAQFLYENWRTLDNERP